MWTLISTPQAMVQGTSFHQLNQYGTIDHPMQWLPRIHCVRRVGVVCAIQQNTVQIWPQRQQHACRVGPIFASPIDPTANEIGANMSEIQIHVFI
jgi:hypothetical protein